VSAATTPTLIVLDAGGTLVDCTGPTRSAQLAAASPLEEDEVRAYVHERVLIRPAGLFYEQFVQQACRRLQCSAEQFPYRPDWPHPEVYRLRVDAAHAVAMFREMAPVVVLSNVSPFDDLRGFLCDSLGFKADEVYLSHELGLSKPDWRTFLAVAQDRHRSVSDLMVVGDSWCNDVLSALPAGARACWLRPDTESAARNNVADTFGVIAGSTLTELARKARDRWWP
jgi:FMN phosphatase YigB (HAD superfamily)